MTQWLGPHLANRRLGYGSSNLGTSVLSLLLSLGILGVLALVGNQFYMKILRKWEDV
jgi:hypothetical protein